MGTKREAPPLPGDDLFDGDYSDEKRRQVARSDAARLHDSRKYMFRDALPRRDLPLFDWLRRERAIEIRRRQLQRGEGNSSAATASPPLRRQLQRRKGSSSVSTGPSAAVPGAPPPEDYDPERFGVTLGPEDFVPEEQLAQRMAAAVMLSRNEAAEQAATAKLKEELNDALLQRRQHAPIRRRPRIR